MDKKQFEQPVIEEVEKIEDLEAGKEEEPKKVEKAEVAPEQQPKKTDGKIDSVEDLNRVAAELKTTGDEKGLLKLAEQYGMDKEDVEDYMDDVVPEFATPLMAAVGKLKHEAAVLGLQGVVKDWEECIEQMCTDDEEMCRAVIKSDRKLTDCMGKILKYAFDNKARVNDDVVKAASLRTPIYLGVPGKAELKKLITEYYMG